jgi:hypothetical protein
MGTSRRSQDIFTIISKKEMFENEVDIMFLRPGMFLWSLGLFFLIQVSSSLTSISLKQAFACIFTQKPH